MNDRERIDGIVALIEQAMNEGLSAEWIRMKVEQQGIGLKISGNVSTDYIKLRLGQMAHGRAVEFSMKGRKAGIVFDSHTGEELAAPPEPAWRRQDRHRPAPIAIRLTAAELRQLDRHVRGPDDSRHKAAARLLREAIGKDPQ